MEITHHPRGELLELRLNGRIDATWGEHLSTTIEKAVRAGSHHLALNCSGVNYISSLGIGVIVTHYKVLKSVNGSLVVTHPSKFVRQILDTVGLTSILIDGADAPTAASVTARLYLDRGPGQAYAVARSTRIVFTYCYHPVAAGAGKSASDHLPNVTGGGSFPPVQATVDLIQKLVPNVKAVGTVYNSSEANSVKVISVGRDIFRKRGISLQEVTVTNTSEYFRRHRWRAIAMSRRCGSRATTPHCRASTRL